MDDTMVTWEESGRVEHEVQEDTAESCDLSHSERCKETAGLHLDRQKTLLLEQRRRGQRHDTHGKWSQMCPGEVRDPRKSKEDITSQQSALSWNRGKRKRMRRWKNKHVKMTSNPNTKTSNRKSRMQNRRRCRRLRQKKAAVAEAATAALTAAADGDAITKNSAEAAEATVAAEAQDKDEEILALIQERKTTGKHEKERIANSAKDQTVHQRKKDDEAIKYIEDIGRTQRNKEHLQYQDGKKANPYPKDQKQKKEKPSTQEMALQVYSLNSTRICTVAKKVKKTKMNKKQKRALRTKKKNAWSIQHHSRVYKKRDPRCYRPPQER